MKPVPHRSGTSPVATSGRSRRASAVAFRNVSVLSTRTPPSSPPRLQISANRDNSSAVETRLDDGTTLVRNAGVLVNGMIWCMVPPTASLKARASGAGTGLPVGWLGATKGTSCSATP